MEIEEFEVGEDELAIIDSLTGILKGNLNNIQYAIPVAGPITALSQYAYRIKLLPGNLKRGKAVQQAISILLGQKELELSSVDLADQGQTEFLIKVRDFIKAIPDSEMNQTMLSHVKIAASVKEIAKSKKAIAKGKKNIS